MQKIVLASGNAKKVKELSELLASFDYQIIPQTELNVSEVPETGTTFVENAIIKARHAAKITGLPAIADDSGIEVDYLKGMPGIYSARFAALDDPEHQATLMTRPIMIYCLRSLKAYQQHNVKHATNAFWCSWNMLMTQPRLLSGQLGRPHS